MLGVKSSESSNLSLGAIIGNRDAPLIGYHKGYRLSKLYEKVAALDIRVNKYHSVSHLPMSLTSKVFNGDVPDFDWY